MSGDKIFFTSDQHFFHANILKYCPNRVFSSVEEMNFGIVKLFNEVVEQSSVTYHLGDFSMGLESMQKMLPKLNGTHHLILGNHDKAHPINCKSKEKLEKFKQLYIDAGFSSIQVEMKLNIGGKEVLLHHLPYEGDHSEKDRHSKIRPKDEGLWLIHGHVHQHWRVKGRQINVGIDAPGNNLKPVSISEIEAIINGTTPIDSEYKN